MKKIFGTSFPELIPIIIFTLFLGIINTFPLIFNINDQILGDTKSDTLYFLNGTWSIKNFNLTFNKNFETNYIFYPETVSIFSTGYCVLRGLYSFLIPTENYIFIHNFLLILSYVFSGVILYFFLSYYKFNEVSKYISVMLFLLSPFRGYHQIGHLDLLHNETLILFCFFWIRYLKDNKRINLDLTILSLCFLFITNYYLLFSGMLFCLLAYIYFSKMNFKKYFILIITILFVIIMCFLMNKIETIKKDFEIPFFGGADSFSNSILSMLAPYSQSVISRLLPFKKDFGIEISNSVGILGIFILIYYFIKLENENKDIKFWFYQSLFFIIYSMGPYLKFYINPIKIPLLNTYLPMPYMVIHYIPILNNLRCPGRSFVMVYLGLTFLTAHLLTKIIEKIDIIKSGIKLYYKYLVYIFCIFMILIEFLNYNNKLIKPKLPDYYQKIKADSRQLSILEIPFMLRSGFWTFGRYGEHTEIYLYYQTIHKKRIVTGVVSRVSLEKVDNILTLPIIKSIYELQNGNKISIDRLKKDIFISKYFFNETRFGYIIIHKKFLNEATINSLKNYISYLSGTIKDFEDSEIVAYITKI